MLDPIIKTIEVPCSQERAFTVFLNRNGHLVARSANSPVSAMGGAPAKAIRVEAKQGGKIVEIGPNGTEYCGARSNHTIRTPSSVWTSNFAPPGEKVDARTLVEVRFTALGNKRTRVVLTQSNWEAFGEKAAMLRDRGYSQAWVAIFEGAFKAALRRLTCGASCCSSGKGRPALRRRGRGTRRVRQRQLASGCRRGTARDAASSPGSWRAAPAVW